MNYTELLKAFLQEAIDKNQLDHFGYLLIPDDAYLNDEALSYLKIDWKKFVEANPVSPQSPERKPE